MVTLGLCQKKPVSQELLAQALERPACHSIELPTKKAHAFPGMTIRSADGDRLILTCNDTKVIFALGDAVFEEDTLCFDADVSIDTFIASSSRAQHGARILRWLSIVGANVSGGIAPWILMAGETLESVPRGRSAQEQIRRVILVLEAIFVAHTAMQPSATTLYQKLIKAFFREVVLNLGAAVPSVFARDVGHKCSRSGESPGGDVAKFIVKLVGELIKLSFERRLPLLQGVAKVTVATLTTVLKHLAVGTVQRTTEGYTKTGRQIIAFLRDHGVYISRVEEAQIIKEMATNADEFIRVLVKLRATVEATSVDKPTPLGTAPFIRVAAREDKATPLGTNPFTLAPTDFTEGVRHDHEPTGRWKEVQKASSCAAGLARGVGNLVVGAFSEVGVTKEGIVEGNAAAECLCSFSDRPEVVIKSALREFNPHPIRTREGHVLRFAGFPLAHRHLKHYLEGGGADLQVDLRHVIKNDKGVRARLSRAMRLAKRDHVKIDQSHYDDHDFRQAFGAIDRVDFEVDSATSLAHVWFKDRYEWHPMGFGYKKKEGDFKRGNNCIHAAAVELKAFGAADYWMIGDTIVPQVFFSFV